MLNIKLQNQTTVEEKIQDAMRTIPFYAPEWTNFNPADPGLTILEVLSASNTLQEASVAQIPGEVRRRLLSLVGIQPKKSKAAKVLLAVGGTKRKLMLPANQRFMLGSLPFETDRIMTVGGSRILRVVTKKAHAKEEKDISFVLDDDVVIPSLLFGEVPTEGDMIGLYVDELPEPGTEMIFYFRFEENELRNPIEERSRTMFATVKWELYTEEGFVELSARDYTASLLTSGELRLRMPKEAPAKYAGDGGVARNYFLRGTLVSAGYDIAPKLHGVSGFLFEVFQKDTKCQVFSIQKPSAARLYSDLAEQGLIRVFGREEKGESFRLYSTEYRDGDKGRFFDVEHVGFGQFEFHFDKERFGFAPRRMKNAVRVVCYTEDSSSKYELGQIYGYDNQEIRLPYEHIVRSSFCLLAERTLADGSKVYDFVRPEKPGEGSFYYHLHENEGTIVIEDAGSFIGARLLLASCATSSGSAGNVRAGKHFEAKDVPEDVIFYNPGPGVGGRYAETFDEMKERFQLDVRTPKVAVTAVDYERIVCSTPGLCIRKATAMMDYDSHCVRVVVLPELGIDGWEMEDTYVNSIMERLEQTRLLTTRVQLSEARYLPVNVRGKIQAKQGRVEKVREAAEEVLRRYLDYRTNEKHFGEKLKFDEVYRALERIPDVICVYELWIKAQGAGLYKMENDDILPAPDCLCVPQDIDIEIL